MKPSWGRKLKRRSGILILIAAIFSLVVVWQWTSSGHLGKFELSERSAVGSLQGNKPRDWQSGTFCREFLVNTLTDLLPICEDNSNRIVCHGSPFTIMATCTLAHVAVIPRNAYYLDTFDDGGIWLQPQDQSSDIRQCTETDYSSLMLHVERGDYMERIVKTAAVSSPKASCDVMHLGTSYVYIGFASHIYFKFIVWYNLFKAIHDNGGDSTMVIRLSKGKTPFTFPEMEKSLFSNVVPVEMIQNGDSIHCFQKLVLVPWTYSSVLFQCKNKKALVQNCLLCNGTGLSDTLFMKFRQKVLDVCGLEDETRCGPLGPVPHKIVLILRKPYHRFIGDNDRSFSRVLLNSEELAAKLKSAFPSSEVLPTYMEGLPLCEQIRLAHSADVLVGVHGAGLVHLWWLQDHALMFEISPSSQLSNPTFKMLSTLTGRRYFGYYVKAFTDKVVKIPDIDDLIQTLTQAYQLDAS